MNTSNKIAIAALIASLLSVFFTGMTYFSEQASKRGVMGIFILSNEYATNWDNQSSTSEVVFVVSGVITNEGPRSCQVNQLLLHVILPASESVKKYYNSTSYSSTIDFQEAFVNGNYIILDWNNAIFDVGTQRNFTLTMTLNSPDNSFSNLRSTDVQSTIHLQYNDLLGTLVEDHSITNWVQTNFASLST